MAKASTSKSSTIVQVEDLTYDESTVESEQMFEIANVNGADDEIDPLAVVIRNPFEEEQIKVEPDFHFNEDDESQEFNQEYGEDYQNMDEDAEFVITEIDDPNAYAAFENEESSTSSQQPQYNCKVCGKSFIYLKSFNQHRLTHALRTDMTECQICHKELKRSAMDYHMKYKHSEERNFQCALCFSRFKSPGALRHHVATFHPYKGIECDDCERVFKTTEHLKKHREIAHRFKKRGVEKYVCEYCKKEFDKQGQLTLHIGILGKKLGKCRDTL
ncbi:hypothetical protein PVAND_014883 [Polypedilum vanderplanki]|uniref:C2H2-type domain-containing protein n=1 Tax=Polypedilum vanderplanki TaxID=319348 RepID=A0A9J6BBG5_POLVA|nr:hypothetical protein PVAND_014883 [Polypedilum vanderplanki]